MNNAGHGEDCAPLKGRRLVPHEKQASVTPTRRRAYLTPECPSGSRRTGFGHHRRCTPRACRCRGVRTVEHRPYPGKDRGEEDVSRRPHSITSLQRCGQMKLTNVPVLPPPPSPHLPAQACHLFVVQTHSPVLAILRWTLNTLAMTGGHDTAKEIL